MYLGTFIVAEVDTFRGPARLEGVHCIYFTVAEEADLHWSGKIIYHLSRLCTVSYQ